MLLDILNLKLLISEFHILRIKINLDLLCLHIFIVSIVRLLIFFLIHLPYNYFSQR